MPQGGESQSNELKPTDELQSRVLAHIYQDDVADDGCCAGFDVGDVRKTGEVVISFMAP